MLYRLPILFALLAALLAVPALAAGSKVSGGAAPKALDRVVIQINEDDARKWHAVLANIHNIQTELGAGNVEVAVVVIGPGLGMLMADALTANDVRDAMAAGVEFVARGNSMTARKIDKADLIEDIGIAAAGYVELMRRQQRGWAHLRP